MRKDAKTRLAEAAAEMGIEKAREFLQFAEIANKVKPARAEKEKQPKPAVKVAGAPRTE